MRALLEYFSLWDAAVAVAATVVVTVAASASTSASATASATAMATALAINKTHTFCEAHMTLPHSSPFIHSSSSLC